MSLDFSALRNLALDLNLDAHGFAVTVTRPAPDNAPIATRGIWLRPLTEGQPFGTDFRNRQPRRTLVLPKDEVPNVPRGTIIAAPEVLGGATVNWQADNYDPAAENDLWYIPVARVA